MCKSTVDTSIMECKCNGGVNPAAFAGYDRAAIVTGMCMTWRHDYGLLKDTILDPCGTVEFHELTVIAAMSCREDVWKSLI